MADTALIRHLIGRLSLDTRSFSDGARRARSESENLNRSMNRSFGKGIQSLEVLGKTLRGGAIVGGMAAISAKSIQFYDTWQKINATMAEFPGVVSNSEAAVLSFFQSLPMIGDRFDIGEEVKQAKALDDVFHETVNKLKQMQRSNNLLFLEGDAKNLEQFKNNLESIKDTLQLMRRTAFKNDQVGIMGTIDKEYQRIKNSEAFLVNLAKQRPIVDAIKKASESAANFGLTEKEIAVRRLADLGASKAAIEEIGRAYDKLDAKQKRAERAKEAKELTKSARTPTERFKDDLAEWQSLLGQELISSQTMARLIAGRVGEQSSATLPNLAVRGTQAAESMISRAGLGETKKTQEQILKEIMKLLQETKNGNDLFRRLSEKFGNGADLN